MRIPIQIIIRTDPQGTLAEFERILEECYQTDGVESLFILSCDENKFTPQEINPILQSIDIPVFGGVFPEIISANQKLSRGSLVAGLGTKPEIVFVPGLSDSDIDYADFLEERLPEEVPQDTMFVIVDGLSARISEFINGLYEVFGLELKGCLFFKWNQSVEQNRLLLRQTFQFLCDQLSCSLYFSRS